MSKVAVVYWSGTGNTEMMAQKVAEGAKEAGAEVSVLTCADFSADDVDAYDAIAFGCPAMGAEELEDTEFGFTCGEHWLELGIFQLFCPHSRASESDCIVCIYIIRREICASQNRNFCACLLCSLCYFLCHHFCVAGSTPINYCYFAHVSNPSFFIF